MLVLYTTVLLYEIKFLCYTWENQVAQSEAEKKLKKDDKKKELQELNELFKPVVAAQKISKGKL